MDEKSLNIKKIVITVAIFVFAFLIIVLSAILTSKSTKSREEKDLEIRNMAEVVSENETQSEDNSISENTPIIDKEENGEDKEKKNISENISEIFGKHDASDSNNENAKKIPVYNENAQDLVKGIYGSDEKQIFLTFDDGPSPNITPQILKTLADYNVPATFFVLGSRVELYPDLLKQEYEAGHYIANHGYTHKYSEIYRSVQTVIDEYNSTETAIQNALGIPEYHSYLFRFPGGSSGGPYDSLKAEAKQYLINNGIASTNWNCLTGDAEAVGRTKEQLLKELYDTAAGHSSLVVLMHDANDKQATADVLPEIIEHYMAEGYTFKNYYEIFK